MTSKEIYNILCEDYDEVIGRLMSPTLLNKVLTMFKNDTNMSELKNALSCNDAETAFRASHTLKGIALNLNLKKLASAASVLTEMLRSGQIPADAQNAYSDLEKQYNEVISLISQID